MLLLLLVEIIIFYNRFTKKFLVQYKLDKHVIIIKIEVFIWILWISGQNLKKI